MEETLTLRQAAARFGVSRQRIHAFLANRNLLEHCQPLYVDQHGRKFCLQIPLHFFASAPFAQKEKKS